MTKTLIRGSTRAANESINGRSLHFSAKCRRTSRMLVVCAAHALMRCAFLRREGGVEVEAAGGEAVEGEASEVVDGEPRDGRDICSGKAGEWGAASSLERLDLFDLCRPIDGKQR